MPISFYNDWVGVALDEAEHFAMLAARLDDLDAAYGDMVAHDRLWEAALKSKDDLAYRLALVPMILEARGLDTTPAAVQRFKEADDPKTAAILEQIGAEEIPPCGGRSALVRVFMQSTCRQTNPYIPQNRYHTIQRPHNTTVQYPGPNSRRNG